MRYFLPLSHFPLSLSPSLLPFSVQAAGRGGSTQVSFHEQENGHRNLPPKNAVNKGTLHTHTHISTLYTHVHLLHSPHTDIFLPTTHHTPHRAFSRSLLMTSSAASSTSHTHLLPPPLSTAPSSPTPQASRSPWAMPQGQTQSQWLSNISLTSLMMKQRVQGSQTRMWSTHGRTMLSHCGSG